LKQTIAVYRVGKKTSQGVNLNVFTNSMRETCTENNLRNRSEQQCWESWMVGEYSRTCKLQGICICTL